MLSLLVVAASVQFSESTVRPIAEWVRPHAVSRELQGKNVAAYGGVPPPELVAELVEGTFEREGKDLRLVRSLATERALKGWHRELRETSVKTALSLRAKTRRMKPLDEAQAIAKALLDPTAREPTNAAGRLAETLLFSIPPAQLAAIPIGESVTYGSRPIPGLSRLPPLASIEFDRYTEILAALQVALQEAEVPDERSTLVRQFLGPTESPPSGYVLLFRVFAGPGSLSATLGLYDAQGARRDFGVSRLVLARDVAPTKMVVPSDRVAPGPLARAWAEGKSTPELLAALRGPEPVGALLEDAFRSASKALGRPILVDLEDRGAEVARQIGRLDQVSLAEFANFCAQEGLPWVERGEWILVRARDPLGAAIERVDRKALRHHIDSLVKDKRRDNATLGRFACDTGPLAYDGDFARAVDRLITQQGVPERTNPPASYALALYGSLDPATRDHLARGGSVSLSQLSARQQQWAWRCMRPFDNPGPAPEIDRHPAVALPKGPAEAILFAPASSTPVVLGFDSAGKPIPEFGNGLSAADWRSAREHGGPATLPAGARFALGKRGGVTFRFVAPNATTFLFDLPDLPQLEAGLVDHLPEEYRSPGTGGSREVYSLPH
ncbi:MAG TPA: hypothetical protein PLH94_04515 [Fimbriimonadaceae bacterium]|nr:hypothetical protein [Fimbriimonadaceae bacterium]